MTCYFRHMSELFRKADIVVTKENRQVLDKIIHNLVNTKYKNCPNTWKEIKKRIAEDEAGFVQALKTAWNNHK